MQAAAQWRLPSPPYPAPRRAGSCPEISRVRLARALWLPRTPEQAWPQSLQWLRRGACIAHRQGPPAALRQWRPAVRPPRRTCPRRGSREWRAASRAGRRRPSLRQARLLWGRLRPAHSSHCAHAQRVRSNEVALYCACHGAAADEQRWLPYVRWQRWVARTLSDSSARSCASSSSSSTSTKWPEGDSDRRVPEYTDLHA